MAQLDALAGLGVGAERIYVDKGLMRTRQGMKVAKAKGRVRGKQPKLNPRQEAYLVALHAAGEHTSVELAELFGVARSTVYRALERAARPGVASVA